MKIDEPFRRVARSHTFVARVGRKRHRGPDGLAKDQVRPRVVDCLAGPLARITAIAALTALAVGQRPRSGASIRVLYLLVVVSAAVLCGTRLAGVIAALGATVSESSGVVITNGKTPTLPLHPEKPSHHQGVSR
jgi:hypothetical protein